MEFVECRRHDTIWIEERVRLTVLERERNSVTLSLVAGVGCTVRFAYPDMRVEAVDARHTRYLLPLLTGDCFTVDDILIGVGLYLDRREIADNDDCDVQLQISRMACERCVDTPPMDKDARTDVASARTTGPMQIRFLRTDDVAERERSASCLP